MDGTTFYSGREVPCALKPHVHRGISKKILGSLSEHGCQNFFFDWVKNYRPYELGIAEDELKMCPLINCRKSFETTDMAIDHALDCPHLSNAWYLCPSHMRPERFIKCSKGCEIRQKPTINQAAKFFNFLGRMCSLRRQAELEGKLVNEALHDRRLKELDTGTDSSGSYPSSSLMGGNSAKMSPWGNQMVGSRRPPSQIAEAYGECLSAPSELAVSRNSGVPPPYKIYDAFAPGTKIEMPSSPWRRSSPELHHPVNSESDRESLWQRMRAMPAADCRRSGTNKGRKSSISSSSLGPSKSGDSAQILLDVGHEVPASRTFQNSKSPDESSDPDQFRMDSSHTEVTLQSSDMLSPISQIANVGYPQSTIVSSATATHHEPGLGRVEHQKENAGGGRSPVPLPLQSMLEEPDDTHSPFVSIDSYLQTLPPFFNSVESSVPTVQHQETSILQASLPAVHHRQPFEELDTPSFTYEPHHLRTHASASENSFHSNRFNKPTEAELSSSTIQSLATQVDTSRLGNHGFLPIASSSVSPPRSSPAESDSRSANDFQPLQETTRSSTAFYNSSFSAPLNHQIGIVHDSVIKEMEMCDIDNSETNINHLEQVDAGHCLSFPQRQLLRPLDYVVGTNILGLRSTSPQWYSNDDCPQTSTQHCGHSFATSQKLDVKSQPHCYDHNSLMVIRSGPKQEQVRELQKIFRVVNSEWIQRMESLPALQSLCKTLSTSNLFEKAVRSLKDFFCSRHTQSFEDVFAMIHLAFATALSSSWHQDFYSFDALHEDALRWQYTLSSDEDKTRFLNAMECWRPHELEPTPLSTSFDSMAPLGSLYCDDQQTLWAKLRKGEVLEACITFLDDFERADVQERNDAFPAQGIRYFAWETQQMIEHITQPLQRRRGIEALQRVVIDTELQLDLGMLRSTREVEVALLTSGRWHSESREVLERFYDSVTSQCDEVGAMLSSSLDQHLNWRHRHYVLDLDKVLEILRISDRQQPNGSAVSQWPDPSVPARVRRDHPVLDSLPSLPSTTNGTSTLEPSPNSVMSWKSTDSSRTAEASSHTTSPTTTSQTSISPSSPHSSTLATPAVTCPSCSKVFKGSLQDALSNLRRHQRSSLRHNKDGGLKCPLPGCEKKSSMRSDNLGPHLLKFHDMSAKSERQSIINGCKLLARRDGSNGKARRRSYRQETTDTSAVNDK